MKKTQIQIVKDQLKENGMVSRNWCLQRYISRLSAIIQVLELEGFEFTTEHLEGDYVYRKVGVPKKIVWEHVPVVSPEGILVMRPVKKIIDVC